MTTARGRKIDDLPILIKINQSRKLLNKVPFLTGFSFTTQLSFVVLIFLFLSIPLTVLSVKTIRDLRSRAANTCGEGCTYPSLSVTRKNMPEYQLEYCFQGVARGTQGYCQKLPAFSTNNGFRTVTVADDFVYNYWVEIKTYLTSEGWHSWHSSTVSADCNPNKTKDTTSTCPAAVGWPLPTYSFQAVWAGTMTNACNGGPVGCNSRVLARNGGTFAMFTNLSPESNFDVWININRPDGSDVGTFEAQTGLRTGSCSCPPPPPSCSNKCSPSGAKKCTSDNTGFQTCGDYNSDGCTEWSSPKACPSGQTCSGAGDCSGGGTTPPIQDFSMDIVSTTQANFSWSWSGQCATEQLTVGTSGTNYVDVLNTKVKTVDVNICNHSATMNFSPGLNPAQRYYAVITVSSPPVQATNIASDTVPAGGGGLRITDLRWFGYGFSDSTHAGLVWTPLTTDCAKNGVYVQLTIGTRYDGNYANVLNSKVGTNDRVDACSGGASVTLSTPAQDGQTYYAVITAANPPVQGSNVTEGLTYRADFQPATNLRIDPLSSASCKSNGKVDVTFRWDRSISTSAAVEQWVDLSLQNNNFAAGTFIGAGPFKPERTSYTWTDIDSGKTHYWRVNTKFPGGSDGQWRPSGTASFTTPDCGVQPPPPPAPTPTISAVKPALLSPVGGQEVDPNNFDFSWRSDPSGQIKKYAIWMKVDSSNFDEKNYYAKEVATTACDASNCRASIKGNWAWQTTSSKSAKEPSPLPAGTNWWWQVIACLDSSCAFDKGWLVSDVASFKVGMVTPQDKLTIDFVRIPLGQRTQASNTSSLVLGTIVSIADPPPYGVVNKNYMGADVLGILSFSAELGRYLRAEETTINISGQKPPGLDVNDNVDYIDGVPLTAGTYNFTIYVYSIPTKAAGAKSTSITVLSEDVLSAPTNLRYDTSEFGCGLDDKAMVVLRWDTASGAEGYWVDVAQNKEDLEGQTGTFAHMDAGANTIVTWGGFNAGTHYWRVWAYRHVGGVLISKYGYPVGQFETFDAPKCGQVQASGGGGVGWYVPFRDPSVKIIDPEGGFFQTYQVSKWEKGCYALNGGEAGCRQKYDYVVKTSVANGWNPAWIVALWRHESGGTTNIGYIYEGCMDSIEDNLECAFNDPLYKDEHNFENFVRHWCGTAAPEEICYNNPGFVSDMASIYDQLVPPGNPGARTIGMNEFQKLVFSPILGP